MRDNEEEHRETYMHMLRKTWSGLEVTRSNSDLAENRATVSPGLTASQRTTTCMVPVGNSKMWREFVDCERQDCHVDGMGLG